MHDRCVACKIEEIRKIRVDMGQGADKEYIIYSEKNGDGVGCALEMYHFRKLGVVLKAIRHGDQIRNSILPASELL